MLHPISLTPTDWIALAFTCSDADVADHPQEPLSSFLPSAAPSSWVQES